MYVCMMCTTCILGAHEGQKRTMDVLSLELRMAVSHHVGSGDQPQVCVWAATALHC